MKFSISKDLKEFSVLLRSVPPALTTLFVLAVVLMNLLANKSVSLPVEWLALDAGIIVSWFIFLVLDMLTKHFGPKAATELSVFAIVMNLLVCLVFYIGSIIPGNWGESYVASGEAVNKALDNTFRGTWYVLAGSTLAFFVSSVVNNIVNFSVGQILKKDSFTVYAIRSYMSTAVGQFTDNLLFALLVSHIFFGWTLSQCVACAFAGMVVELICEVIFALFGFKICRYWEKVGVGKEYLEMKR